LLTALALAGVTDVRAQALGLIPGIEEIASDSIRDLAVAAVDREVPAIYYNPRLARRYGPELTRFFLAHEYGHLNFRHTRTGLRDLPDATRDSVLRTQELEADCYAARLEGAEARLATETALRFFARLGPFRFDNEHPTGAQRASRILMCLPGPRAQVGRRADRRETGPVSGEPERIRFAVTGAHADPGGARREAEVWSRDGGSGRSPTCARPPSCR
jgi:hypothetical protein